MCFRSHAPDEEQGSRGEPIHTGRKGKTERGLWVAQRAKRVLWERSTVRRVKRRATATIGIVTDRGVGLIIKKEKKRQKE